MFPIASASVRIQPDFTGFAAATRVGTNAAIGQTAASARTLGAGLSAAVTLPIAAIGVASVKTFADFDSALTESLAIVEDFGTTTRADFEKTARDVAKSTTFGAAQAAEAFFFLASAGFTAEQQIKALPQVAAFAEAGMFDLATATDLATDAQSALGLTVSNPIKNLENLTRVTDTLVKANTLANASVEQFSTSLTNKAGTALKLVNKDIEEGVAVLAVYADKGIKGQIAGENLSRVIRTLNINAIQNADAFKQLNIEVFDQEGNMRNLADIVEDVTEAFEPMNDQQKTAALLSLGFTARSQDVVKALIGTEDQIRNYESALRDAGGITETVANRQLESFSAKMNLAKSRITDVAISLGKELVPVVLTVTTGIATMVEAFAAAPAPIKQTVAIIAGFAALAGPILLLGGSIAKSVLAFRALSGGQVAGAATANTYAAAQGRAAAATSALGVASGRAATGVGALGIAQSNAALRSAIPSAATGGFFAGGAGNLLKAGGFALGGNLIGGLIQGIGTEEGTVQDKVKDVTGNAIRGAGIGAAVGTIVPVVGTGIGAAVGAAAGGLLGFFTSGNGQQVVESATTEVRDRIADAMAGLGLSEREQQAVATILDGQVANAIRLGIEGGLDEVEGAGLGDFAESVIAGLLEAGVDPVAIGDEIIGPRILDGFNRGLSPGRIADQLARDFRGGGFGLDEIGAAAADELAEGLEENLPTAFQEIFALVQSEGGSILQALNAGLAAGERPDIGFVTEAILGQLSTVPSIFEEQFDLAKTVSVDKMLEIAQANTDAFAEFEGNIRTLAEAGLFALADTIAQKGPAAAAEAAALAQDIPAAIAIEAELSNLGRAGVEAFLTEFETADTDQLVTGFINRFIDPLREAELQAEAEAKADELREAAAEFEAAGTEGGETYTNALTEAVDTAPVNGFTNFGVSGVTAIGDVLSPAAARSIANPFVAEINRVLSAATFSVQAPTITGGGASFSGGGGGGGGGSQVPFASPASTTNITINNPTVQSADRDAQKAAVLDRLVGAV